MPREPRCPWCGAELESTLDDGVYLCPVCNELFYYDEDSGEVDHYEPISHDDYELADFCRGGDLSED